MKKLAETVDGTVIIEISLDEWEHIEDYGLDVILKSAQSDKYYRDLREQWSNTPACKILKPFYSNGLYAPLFTLFVFHNKVGFDGSVEQLHMIAQGTPPFDNIRLFGKGKRKILSKILSGIQEKT
jgi:hypothetical protein